MKNKISFSVGEYKVVADIDKGSNGINGLSVYIANKDDVFCQDLVYIENSFSVNPVNDSVTIYDDRVDVYLALPDRF